MATSVKKPELSDADTMSGSPWPSAISAGGGTVNPMTRVLGIDPGLTRTGYALVVGTGDKPHAERYGVIRTSPAEPDHIRLAEIAGDIAGLLAETTPDILAIERVFLHHNRATAVGVARASGVILAAAGNAGVRTVEYSPTQIKSVVAGDGNAPKPQMQRIVTLRLSLDAIPEPPDVADALAIALCHLTHTRTLTVKERI